MFLVLPKPSASQLGCLLPLQQDHLPGQTPREGSNFTAAFPPLLLGQEQLISFLTLIFSSQLSVALLSLWGAGAVLYFLPCHYAELGANSSAGSPEGTPLSCSRGAVPVPLHRSTHPTSLPPLSPSNHVPAQTLMPLQTVPAHPCWLQRHHELGKE